MDNVVLVTFEDEGKAYEEFNRLKDNEATADFTILEMAVVKNVDGAIMVPDGFQDGYDETDNTAFGGVHWRGRRPARRPGGRASGRWHRARGRHGNGRQGRR